MYVLNHFVSGQLNLGSNVITMPQPDIANVTNAAELNDHVTNCQKVLKQTPNFIAVDFYEKGNLLQVVAQDVPGLLPEGKECAIGLGYLCLYNHSDTPNITFDHHYDSDEISVRATRDIAAGEELTLNYGVPLWFEDAGSVSK